MVVTNNSVSKENGKLHIYMDFHKLNETTKKNMYPLAFIDEVSNIVVDHEAYLFLEGNYGYHKISIAPHHELPIL
jgi:hypothetical protein